MKFTKTATESVAEECGVSLQRAEQLLKYTTEEERAKIAREAREKSPVKKIFDRLVGRQHLLLEALGFLNDEWKDRKGCAVHQTVIGIVRDAQDELKKAYKELRE